MVSLLKAARFVFLSILAGAFLAVGSQSIVPVNDAEAGMETGVVETIVSDDIVATADGQPRSGIR